MCTRESSDILFDLRSFEGQISYGLRSRNALLSEHYNVLFLTKFQHSDLHFEFLIALTQTLSYVECILYTLIKSLYTQLAFQFASQFAFELLNYRLIANIRKPSPTCDCWLNQFATISNHFEIQNLNQNQRRIKKQIIDLNDRTVDELFAFAKLQ